MFGEVVDGIDGHLFERALADLKRRRGVAADTDLGADDLEELVGTFKRIYRDEKGSDFPPDAREQLVRSIRAVFESWDTPRAKVYRRAHEIPDTLGTAVNVVQMVFGNKGERSGTGVAFTRDPSTGENGIYGEFLANAQGEDVVAGIRTPQPVEAMRRRCRTPTTSSSRRCADRAPLPRPSGHRVHGRGRHALPASDARRQADRRGGAEVCGVDGRGGADHARGRDRPHRPGTARPASAPDDRSEGGR